MIKFLICKFLKMAYFVATLRLPYTNAQAIHVRYEWGKVTSLTSYEDIIQSLLALEIQHLKVAVKQPFFNFVKTISVAKSKRDIKLIYKKLFEMSLLSIRIHLIMMCSVFLNLYYVLLLQAGKFSGKMAFFKLKMTQNGTKSIMTCYHGNK